jgi:hypothetical protein
MAEVEPPVTGAAGAAEGAPSIEPASPSQASFERVLASARARMGAFAVGETLLAVAAGGALGLVAALLVVGVAPYSLALRVALIALVALAATAAGAAVAWRRALPLKHDLVVGAALEASLRRRGAELGDMVRAAVELRDDSLDSLRGRSRALCEAHIAATTAKVVEGGGLASLPGVALERAVPTLAGAGAIGIVLAAWAIAGSTSFHARWDTLFSDEGGRKALEEQAASLLPLVTDLKLTLRFPAYMQENDEIIPGSSGDVVAPKGTEVTIEGRADRSLAKAGVIVGDGEIGAAVNGAAVSAKFVVDGNASTYRFALTGVRGGRELDPVAHKITIRADAVPVVTLEEPSADATVKIDETVPLSFKATDDVGVTKLRVVVKRQGSARDPYVKDLIEVPGGLKEVRGTGKLKIGDTGARPGDRLSVYVEALDNDVVSGPKPGRSQTRVLTVYSAIEQHKAMIARLDDVLSKMTDSLGDELEAPLKDLGSGLQDQLSAVEKHKSIGDRHQVTQKSLEDALVALAQDQMTPAATRRALANIALHFGHAITVKRDGVSGLAALTSKGLAAGSPVRARLAGAQKSLVENLEDDIPYLDDLLNKERVAEAKLVADDLKRAVEDLKALVDQYKKTGDEATRKALLEQIQAMRQQLRELMDKLAALERDIPDEYLNDEAFAKTKQMMGDADNIDKLIEEGKLDEAAKKLEDMLQQTQKLVDNLDKQGEEYGGDEYKELREKLDKFSRDFEAVQKAQQETLDASQQIMDKAKRAAEEKLKGKLDKALAEVKKKVERAEKKLDSVEQDSLFLNESEDAAFAKARIEDLKRALESKDLEDASSSAEEAEAAARSAQRSVADRSRGQRDKTTNDAKSALGEAQKDLDEAKKELGELMPDPSSLLDGKDRAKLAKDADREEQVREGAEKLSQQMDELGKEAPLFGPEHKKMMEDAKQAMQRAGAQMKMQDVKGARSSQRQALRLLADLRDKLTPKDGGGGKSPGNGMPMPFPGGGSPGSEENGEEDGNSSRMSREDVKIPDGSDFKVPDAYRKDILDAMKEGAPSSWQQEVKRYYESLIK